MKEVYYHKKFLKHYKKRIIPHKSLVQSYEERIRLFFKNPNHPILGDHPLKNDLKDFRSFSITGDIRVIYFLQNDTLHLYDIGTHNQVY